MLEKYTIPAIGGLCGSGPVLIVEGCSSFVAECLNISNYLGWTKNISNVTNPFPTATIILHTTIFGLLGASAAVGIKYCYDKRKVPKKSFYPSSDNL